MKNLKKILMALVLVALLVSSVVTIAIADASYNGNVENAQQLLDAVYAIEAETGSVADAKGPGLKTLYDYLKTVNPQDDGYAEIREAYNSMTFKVMYIYFEEYGAATSDDARAAALTKVHTYKTSTPVIGNVYDVEFAYGYRCETCGEYSDFSEFNFFNGITDDLGCPGKCSDEDCELVYAGDTESYVEFEQAFNKAALSEVELLVGYLFSLEEMSDSQKDIYASYYDLKEARQAVEKFLVEVLEKEYKAPSSALYTGNVTDASAKLRGTTTSSDFDKLKTALASAYTYLVETPVNPTSDEFLKFITNYNALCEALVANLAQRVDACTTPEAKIAELADFRAYLAETLISEYVVDEFNALKAQIADEYTNADMVIGGLDSVDDAVFAPIYSNALEDFASKLDAAEAALAADEDISTLVVELYASYAAAFAYNPEADGYAELVARYLAICDAYVEDAFVAPINDAEIILDKLQLLVVFNGFVAENPISESAIGKYNEIRTALSEKLGAYVSMIDDAELPVYVAPEKEMSTASEAVLESFLEILTDSVDKYSAAEAADKPAAFEDMKKAAAELRTYILGVNLDSDAAYYATFVAEYKAARDSVFAELAALIDAAEGEDIVPTLESVKAFLVEAPLTRDAVDSYNAKVDELVEDTAKAASLKLASAYDEIDALIDAVNETDDVEVLRELGIRLFALSKNSFDVTDPAYTDYIVSNADAMQKIAFAIYADIVAALNASDASQDAALVQGYLKYASDVYVDSVIAQTVSALTAVKDTFDAVNRIIETNGNAGYIASVYENIISIIESFDSAASIAERAEAFEELFDAIWHDCFNTAFISGNSYEAIMLEYERVCLAFEAELIASLNADVSAYDLAKNIEFVYGFVTKLSFSKNVIDAYNVVYEEVSSANFGQLVENVDTVCPSLAYASPENWNPNLARINIAIQQSLDENGLVEEKFNVAYKILNGEIGVAGPQVIDYGADGFYDMIVSFDDVKQNIVEKYSELLASAKDMAGKRVVLEELGDFIDEYPFSKALVDGYNQIRQELRGAYNQDSTACFNRFQTLVNKIYEIIESCPINTTYLSSYDRSVYSIGQELLSAAEFSILENYLEVAMGISGDKALIFQNAAVDELNASIGSFELGSFNEKILVEANLKFAFVKFLEKFDAEIAALPEADKADKIASIGSFIVVKEFPSYLISLYNVKYGTNYSALSVEPANTAADIFAYADLLEDVMVTKNSADARLALLSLVEYVNSHKFSTENTSGDMKAKLDAVKAELEKATKEQKDALDKLVSSEEASYPIIMDYDFDTTGTSFKHASTYGTYGFATVSVVNAPGSTNKCVAYSTDGSPQFNHKITSAAQGLVLDFDVMAPKDGALNFNMYFYGDSKQHIAIDFKNGVLSLNADGRYVYDDYPAGSDPIVATPGEWMHITIAIDHQNGTQELYVDYVSLGKWAVSVTQARLEGAAALRVCPKNSTVYIDNFKIYQGTSYRTLGKLDSATDDEKFEIYLSTLFNEEAKVTDRFAAYYSAQSLKSFVTEECADLVAELNSFDITDIKSEAEAIHLAKIQELVAKVNVDSITTANTATKQADINVANTYIDTNRLYIDQTSAEFRRCTQALIDAADKIVWLDNLKQYIDVIAKFHRATSYASLTKHLENVEYYYNLCELYDADKIATAVKDDVAKAFENQMKADPAVTALVPNITLASYYSEYIPARLAAQMRYENSVKAVDCVAFIDALVENKDALTSDAYKAALLAAAADEDNFDYVDSYLAIVRKVLAGGEYDEEYDGFDHVVEVFEILNPMFFDAAQQRHFENIAAQLEKYAQTNSYIERAGICAYLRNYIADNDVDMSSDEGMKYLYAIEMYEEELVDYKEEYEAILAANTEYFIGMVKKMQAYVEYSDLKPLYEEAIEKYYYSMNVDSEEAKAAIAIFTEYEKKIQDWEENSAMLLVYAKDLKSTRMAQKFRALVRCSAYVGGADAGVSAEVEAAINLYATTYAGYMEMIEPTINETADAANVVSALRTNRLSANVLAMANAIMNK